MLEKIIDKYFAKKLEISFRNSLMMYYIRKRFTYTNHLLELYIKREKDNDFVLIFAIPFSECFEVLIHSESYNYFIKEIENFIKEGS